MGYPVRNQISEGLKSEMEELQAFQNRFGKIIYNISSIETIEYWNWVSLAARTEESSRLRRNTQIRSAYCPVIATTWNWLKVHWASTARLQIMVQWFDFQNVSKGGSFKKKEKQPAVNYFQPFMTKNFVVPYKATDKDLNSEVIFRRLHAFNCETLACQSWLAQSSSRWTSCKSPVPESSVNVFWTICRRN